MPEYIFDTTVLSNFASAHRLDLLEGRYRGVVFTTLEVSNELRKGIKAGYSDLKSALQQIETISPGGWIRLLSPDSAVEHRLQSEFDQFLDAGEASCLALELSHEDSRSSPTIWQYANWPRLEMFPSPAHWVF
jgi:predicted nucleic acid-binding protein